MDYSQQRLIKTLNRKKRKKITGCGMNRTDGRSACGTGLAY